MRVVVTGASEFIGSRLTAALPCKSTLARGVNTPERSAMRAEIAEHRRQLQTAA